MLQHMVSKGPIFAPLPDCGDKNKHIQEPLVAIERHHVKNRTAAHSISPQHVFAYTDYPTQNAGLKNIYEDYQKKRKTC